MRPGNTAELLLDPDEGPMVWFMGAALIVLAFMFGIFLVVQGVGDSMAEICAARGGHYENKTTYTDAGNYKSESETCTPAGSRSR